MMSTGPAATPQLVFREALVLRALERSKVYI